MPEHHRAGRSPTELVPDPIHVQPFLGERLVLGEFFAHAVHEDFAAAAGEAAKTRILESPQYFIKRELVDLVEVPDLGRAEGVKVDLREAALEIAEQVFV